MSSRPRAEGVQGPGSAAHPRRQQPGTSLRTEATSPRASSPRAAPGPVGEDFNLSTAESTTVLELAENIWRRLRGPDVPFRFVRDEPFDHDVQKRVPSVEKSKRVLDFEATTTLDEMLDVVVPWVVDAIDKGLI